MALVHCVLPETPRLTIDDHVAAGGGQGLDAARRLGPAATIELLEASGLRGRGGAGFPTGTKWRTVAENCSPAAPATVVVNAAEGEPGTFKDRAIIRANPFAIVEGAIIAAHAVGADQVVIAVKHTFTLERRLLDEAVKAVCDAGWAEGIAIGVATGPSEYLFGEETGLLEVLAGRPPFPRIAPPYRHGVDEVGPEPAHPAGTVMADVDATSAPPALVNNAETLANVPRILAEGPDEFRRHGTPESPGTIVVTITGATVRHGVGEVPMGTTLAEAIELIGGGARPKQHLVAALSGVANAVITADDFDVPLTYEGLAGIGSGLGSAGFVIFDDDSDMAAVAAGISRFLAVESCGQCTPCKHDGIAIANHLEQVCSSEPTPDDLVAAADHVTTVADGARCALGRQHEAIIGSLLQRFADTFEDHAEGRVPALIPAPVAPIVDIVDGHAVLDEHQWAKQPDWTYGLTYSGQSPADRLG